MFDPWVGKIPWRRKWQPTPVSLPAESHAWRSLGKLQSMGSQRVGHDWVTNTFPFTFGLSPSHTLPWRWSASSVLFLRPSHRGGDGSWQQSWRWTFLPSDSRTWLLTPLCSPWDLLRTYSNYLLTDEKAEAQAECWLLVVEPLTDREKDHPRDFHLFFSCSAGLLSRGTQWTQASPGSFVDVSDKVITQMASIVREGRVWTQPLSSCSVLPVG